MANYYSDTPAIRLHYMNLHASQNE